MPPAYHPGNGANVDLIGPRASSLVEHMPPSCPSRDGALGNRCSLRRSAGSRHELGSRRRFRIGSARRSPVQRRDWSTRWCKSNCCDADRPERYPAGSVPYFMVVPDSAARRCDPKTLAEFGKGRRYDFPHRSDENAIHSPSRRPNRITASAAFKLSEQQPASFELRKSMTQMSRTVIVRDLDNGQTIAYRRETRPRRSRMLSVLVGQNGVDGPVALHPDEASRCGGRA